MSVLRLILREIAHRKLNFALAILSVSAAIACLVGAMTLLSAHETRTQAILAQKRSKTESAIADQQAVVAARGKELQDSMRKITKGLGFNILILPQEQDLNEFYAQGTISSSMPEQLVDKLANSSIVTINHLLPMITRKIAWKERDQTILVTGTRGEVPIMHRDRKKPLLDQVPAGTMVVGYQVHTQQNLNKGDKVTMMGKEFTIEKMHPERGTVDDSTVWINLAEAQELFGMQNLVNAILALECNCATEDRVAEIRAEIAGILPGTQVIERGPSALARAEARNEAKKTAVKALEQEKAAARESLAAEENYQAQLLADLESTASILVPVVIIAGALGIALLAFGNVRQRSNEIGVLRAIGLRAPQILWLFLGKALLIGLVGAGVGYGAGFGIGTLWGDLPTAAGTSAHLFSAQVLFLAIVMALVLSGVASWIPAMVAARQDPAVILQEE